MSYGPHYCEVEPTAYNIGEHAIARIFLRTPPLVDRQTSKLSVNHIISEMQHVPFWSGYWVLSLLDRRGVDFWGVCEPIIPTPNGLFLCALSPSSKHLEVRTFIEDLSLFNI